MRFLLPLLFLILMVPVAHAQPDGGGNNGGIDGGGNGGGGFLINPLGNVDSLDELLAVLLNVLVQIGVIVLTIMIVYCGFLFVTAQGNEEKLRSARSALLWTVIGGLIVLGAEVIATAIRDTVQTL